MRKRTVLFILSGLCVCVLLYGILSKTLKARMVRVPYRITDGVQLEMLAVQKVTPSLNVQGGKQSGLMGDDILAATSEKVSSNHTGNLGEGMPCASTLREELLCALKKNVPFSTIRRKQASKDGNAAILPEESLEKLVHFNSCAVVSSSHALTFHGYGKEIDSHGAVLRFNCAPTDQFEKFVGSRTDIRMVNTLIPLRSCQEEFWSEKSAMFTHATLVVGNMDGINFGRVVMMLHLCDWVRVYELVPSDKDHSNLMYYFDEKTMWTTHHVHSYSQERIYVRTLSLTPEEDIEDTGVVLLKGFTQTQCG
ncbi:hypothetical protein Bbelb_156720 [Branchiostoma belcheri]|nr:hypothetical protein Bbelb_156720 [Branchiostoma belcheri]